MGDVICAICDWRFWSGYGVHFGRIPNQRIPAHRTSNSVAKSERDRYQIHAAACEDAAMSFHKVNEGGARSDAGVVVQIKHPEYLEYRDGQRSVDVSIGYDPSARKIYVYASELTNWKEPDSTMPITEVQKQVIVSNLQEALSLLKGTFVVS